MRYSRTAESARRISARVLEEIRFLGRYLREFVGLDSVAANRRMFRISYSHSNLVYEVLYSPKGEFMGASDYFDKLFVGLACSVFKTSASVQQHYQQRFYFQKSLMYPSVKEFLLWQFGYESL